MQGFNYQIGLQLNGFNQLGAVATNLQALSGSVNTLNRNLQSASGSFGGFRNSGVSAASSLRGEFGSLVASVGGTALAMKSLNTTADFEGMSNAIRFSGGKEGAANLDYLNKEITRLKLPMEAAYEGFKTLSGGLVGTSIDAQKQRTIFTSVAQASRVMGLSAEQQKGSFLALAQMASKGTVSSEELRGQLGERLPGAFAIAARAMGVTTAKLGDMIKDGKVMSEDFLPKFAAELQKTFGGGVDASLNSTRANFDAFNNSLTQLSLTFGTLVIPSLTAFMNTYLIPSIDFIRQNADVIMLLGGTIGFVTLMSKTWAITTALSNGLMSLQRNYLLSGGGAYGIYGAANMAATSATSIFTAAVHNLNAAFRANPIGFVITILGVLVTATVTAWYKWAEFRAFLYGMWGVLKETGAIVYERMILPIVALGKAIIGVFSFDPAMVRSGLEDAQKVIDSFASNTAGRIGKAFTEGWNDGMKSFQDAAKNTATPQTALPTFGGANGAAKDKDKTKADKGTKKSAANISGGGTRNITINITKLVDNFTVQTTTVSESATAVRDILLRELLQVVNAANQVQ